MSSLGALTQAWTSASAALPLGWWIAGVMTDSVYERARYGFVQEIPPATRAWVAIALSADEVPVVGEGDMPEIALQRLADKLRQLRGATTG